MVWPKSSPGLGFRRPRPDPGYLCYDRLHSACPQTSGQGLGLEVFELPVAACHGVRKRRDRVARSVIANDRDGATSGYWGWPPASGSNRPNSGTQDSRLGTALHALRRYSARTAAPAWLEIGMPCQNNEHGGESRMEWFATLLRQADIADSIQ